MKYIKQDRGNFGKNFIKIGNDFVEIIETTDFAENFDMVKIINEIVGINYFANVVKV